MLREVRVFGWSAPSTRSRVGEGLLVQRDRLDSPPGRLVSVGEVVARGQGVGVVGAQQPLGVGKGLLVQRDRLSHRPAAW